MMEEHFRVGSALHRMSFIHPYLLGGLALISVPILVHLIMREKPKLVLFPAFRFLQQTFRTNKRKLRLQHLLLLLLRILLIALLCFALARPRLFSERLLLFGQKQPVVVALLFDTSLSMDYKRGKDGSDRLSEAKAKAKELLPSLPEGSQIVVLDSAERGGQFNKKRDEVIAQIDGLKTRSDNQSLTTQIEWAFETFTEQAQQTPSGEVPPPRYLYVFSDRAQSTWDDAFAKTLNQPEGSRSLFVDVGIENPVDFAIEQVEPQPVSTLPGRTIRLVATIHRIGTQSENLLKATVDTESLTAKTIKAKEGEFQQKTFTQRARLPNEDRKKGLSIGYHQGRMSFSVEDKKTLSFNDKAWFTFQIRSGKSVLTIAQDPRDAFLWQSALRYSGFSSSLVSVDDSDGLTLGALSKHDVVALHELRDPSPELWTTLQQYIKQGGGVLIVPPGEDARLQAYQSPEAKAVMPGELKRIVEPADPVQWNWDDANREHPVLRSFFRWRAIPNIDFEAKDRLPLVKQYWELAPNVPNNVSAVMYQGDKAHATFLEQKLAKGQVVLLSLRMGQSQQWHRYWRSSFAIALIGEFHKYLSDELNQPELNFLTGQRITVPLPSGPLAPRYSLSGTDIDGVIALNAPEAGAERELNLARKFEPGNYRIEDEKQKTIFAFSVNVPPGESDLRKVNVEQIESVLGEKSVVSVEGEASLQDALQDRPQPMELLPLLMLFVLLFLTFENLLANRRREDKPLPVVSSSVGFKTVATLVLWTGAGIALGTVMGMLRLSGYPGALAGACLMGFLGLTHGLIVVSKFSKRDAMILGIILGGLMGILYGGVVLTRIEWMSGVNAVLLGMFSGAVLMGLDGFLTSSLSNPHRETAGG